MKVRARADEIILVLFAKHIEVQYWLLREPCVSPACRAACCVLRAACAC